MLVWVKAKTRSKNPGVDKIDPTHFIVSVSSPPECGKANDEIISRLSFEFNLPPSRIRLVRGHKSSAKIVEVQED